ncbi:MAG: AAA family ATPase [Bacteroidales bacterium]|nr:AAA family ATPase [Bacteroidales bacterium]
MIIKKLVIKNFRSYYGEKVFEFQKGLNLILGANGDGKTTFYDALDFVLTDADFERKSTPLSSCVSKKMFAELKSGQSGVVSVTIEMLNADNHSRTLEHSFVVTKTEEETMSFSAHQHVGYVNLSNGGRKTYLVREMLQGEGLFPAIIKKYSLFKGEKALNIFEDKTTLKNLINLFSDIKDLGPYKTFAKFGEETSSRAVAAAQKKDRLANDASQRLLQDRERLESRLKQEEQRLADLQATYADNQSKIDAIESDLQTIELVHGMQDAIRDLQIELEMKRDQLDENYSTHLLDRLWILNGFQPTLELFAQKMSKLSEQKQTFINLERERIIREKAEREAEQKTIEELKAKLTELPWYIPDVKTMQSMLEKERCLVCGTEAKKGSEAYEHIAKHLQEALDHLSKSKKSDTPEAKAEETFKYRNIELIHQLSIQLYQYGINLGEISYDIEREKQKNDKLYAAINDLSQLIDEKQTDMARVLSQSASGKDIGQLASSWTNIKHWYQTKEDASIEIDRITTKVLPELRKQIADNMDKYKKSVVDATAREFLKINQFYRMLGVALDRAESQSLKEFMDKLATTANRFLDMLNVDDFTGVIRISRDIRDNSIVVQLVDKYGKLIDNPNTSLFTTMHLSVLFAISELTKDNLNNEYPMILDAPTSSFDEGKDKTFYQVMNARLNKQCIIVTKSYLYKDDDDNFAIDEKGIQKLQEIKHIPIYRIQKLEGFDKKDQSTIETVVTPLF